jgi:mannose-6-phosphate isomerase-like protein (cupin superfamily)
MKTHHLPLIAILCAVTSAWAEDRAVDPTFLYRKISDVKPKDVALSSPTAHYKPLFGEGDSKSAIVKGISRFGEITVETGGASKVVSFSREEHILVVLEGEGDLDYAGVKHPVRKHDFLYLPPGVKFGIRGGTGSPVRGIVMGFKIPAGIDLVIPPQLLRANIDEVPKQVVGNHPPSTLYRLLMGDTKSTRDKLAAGHVMKSLFMMEFTPGGTNFPHHHEREEEIYLLLDGEGDMVAGSGVNGIEGRYPARPGDAYFYRVNATVGFYNNSSAGAGPARILAVRSTFPFGIK